MKPPIKMWPWAWGLQWVHYPPLSLEISPSGFGKDSTKFQLQMKQNAVNDSRNRGTSHQPSVLGISLLWKSCTHSAFLFIKHNNWKVYYFYIKYTDNNFVFWHQFSLPVKWESHACHINLFAQFHTPVKLLWEAFSAILDKNHEIHSLYRTSNCPNKHVFT